jgi:hypothetical protein
MKKLLALGAFILMGSMVFAQTPSKQKAAPAPATTMQVAAPAVVEEVSVSEVAVAEKKETKKECSDAEKKQCGTKSGKKSCCSSKAEATKQETK